MNVRISIDLTPDEEVPSRTAVDYLAVLGGDPTTDTISVSVSQFSAPPPPELSNTLPGAPPG